MFSFDEAVKDVFPTVKSVKRGMKPVKCGMKAVERGIRLWTKRDAKLVVCMTQTFTLKREILA